MIDLVLMLALLPVLLFARWLRTEPGRRWHCRKTRHDVRAKRQAPVIPLFFFCRRCGRYARTLDDPMWRL